MRKAVVLSSFDNSSSGKNCASDEDFTLISHMDTVLAVTDDGRNVTKADECLMAEAVSHSGEHDDVWCSDTSEILHFDVPTP